MLLRERLPEYAYLMRLDKPIGILLLLWPTLWAVWLATLGHPSPKILFVFIAGVILMRSAGCVMNDIADRHIDKHVHRTRHRPLTAGKVTTREAILLMLFLAALAFLLVLLCNVLTIMLAIVGAILAVIYPFMKRFTHLPQVGLGVAFSWGVPMAFAATNDAISASAWVLFFATLIWPVIYDTMYAMVDRSDDLRMGVKSTAILFAEKDVFIILVLQTLFLIMLMMVGLLYGLHSAYYIALGSVALLFFYQYHLIKHRHPDACFRAFLNNNWVGFVIFTGIVMSFL